MEATRTAGQVVVSHCGKQPNVGFLQPPSPWMFQELRPNGQERHPSWRAFTAGRSELVGMQVLIFLSQLRRQQTCGGGSEWRAGEKRKENKNAKPESGLFWTPGPPHRRSEQATQKPTCQAGISRFLKKFSSSVWLRASNEQFFPTSSDFRSLEFVELTAHQAHNYGYYREWYAHHQSIWL